MLPAIFVSHGAPTLPLTDVPARHFLQALGAALPERPRAILVVSAHWETTVPTVNSVATNATIHDFNGFPEALYRLAYPAPGSPALARRVAELVGAAGMPTEVDTARGLDHGAWVPLIMMFPDADIPVVQLSVQPQLGPAHHLALGRALAPLRAEGVLILGSGSFTHDLSQFRRGIPTDEPAWVSDFAGWFDKTLAERRIDDLVAYRQLAPNAAQNHPTDEHLLPLYVALGAGGDDAHTRRLHASTTFGVLRMDAYAFGSAADLAMAA